MIKIIPSLVLFLFVAHGCRRHGNAGAIANYDLSKPEVMKMPSVLNEVSGIAFNKGRPDTIYAEQDEEGRLYFFAAATLDVKEQKFGKRGDYEDIAICNGTVVILRSDGVLFSFPLNINGDEKAGNVKETPGLLPGGEYEALYADEAAGQLFVLCKKCGEDNEAKSISGYILQMTPGGGIELKGNFRVNTKDIAAKLNEKKLLFRPSALAKNRVNNEWYILSSVNKLLVTTDDKWSIKDVFPLDPALFDQPEGIAFDRDNNLYISNERGSTGNATILKFTFTNNKK